jgi:hypothetical protein
MDEVSFLTLQQEIEELEQSLADKRHQLEKAQASLAKQATEPAEDHQSQINSYSPPEAKIALFRSLFKGREDI